MKSGSRSGRYAILLGWSFSSTTLLTLAFTLVLAAARSFAAEPALTADPLPDGTDIATKAITTFKIPVGMKIELFAAEPKLGNPVAICLDEKNRVYVAEQYRFNRGTEENRTRPFLLDDDLQIQTTADRLAMFKKFANRFDGGMDWFSKYTDQVRRLEDRDGDGKADRSTIFADGFNGPLDGLAAGLIARDGDIYLTNIPKLWLLQDQDDNGVAEIKQPLLEGFGVNAAFLGHDLHGLVWGPDGKLYFSVGDRGFHVTTKEGAVVSLPRRGAVFRCEPDGSQLEVVHIGLRNPQELAFDEYGNLFADDNNCDKGDHSRLVWVVEGGDSGWNMAFQTLAAPYLTGPWHAEKMWHLADAPGAAEVQPAWILPALGKLGAGPSGFTYYPGTGLPERYRGHFFMCNYTGNGGIESFGVKVKGASFEIVDMHDFLKPMKATDADFGYDGKMYVSDYVNLEWNGGSKGGRIYTLFDPQGIQAATVKQVERLFREGFKQRGDAELAELLKHPDMRVRQRAQFALAERGEKNVVAFTAAIEQTQHPLARLHGIWGVGQIARRKSAVGEKLIAWLQDADPEVRTQVVKTLGAIRAVSVAENVAALLDDASPRVRFHAAIAVGQLSYRPAIAKLFERLKENANQDKYLRHAYVQALTTINDRDALLARAADSDSAVRMGVLLTLRRWKDAAIAQFLTDSNVALVTESARAINDLPIEDGTQALAEVAKRIDYFTSPVADALVRRVVNANFRVGDEDSVRQVAEIAANAKVTEAVRREAIRALSDWATPTSRDRVNGNWRPLPARESATIRRALEPHVPNLLAKASNSLQADVTDLVSKLNLKAEDVLFVEWANDSSRPSATRIAAFDLLARRKYPGLEKMLDDLLVCNEAALRATSRRLLATVNPTRAIVELRKAINSTACEMGEKQAAVLTLADISSDDAGRLLDELLQQALETKLPPELRLDLLEVVERRPTSKSKTVLQELAKRSSEGTPSARFSDSLVGGSAERGREIFSSHPVAQCVRCHKVEGRGGEAGPDLSKVATRGDRSHLLQSLIEPNAKISQGFGTVTLVLNNGQVVGGMLKAENTNALTLLAPSGQEIRVRISDIDERSPALSPMPTVAASLTKREIRDLVEYLSTLK